MKQRISSFLWIVIFLTVWIGGGVILHQRSQFLAEVYATPPPAAPPRPALALFTTK